MGKFWKVCCLLWRGWRTKLWIFLLKQCWSFWICQQLSLSERKLAIGWSLQLDHQTRGFPIRKGSKWQRTHNYSKNTLALSGPGDAEGIVFTLIEHKHGDYLSLLLEWYPQGYTFCTISIYLLPGACKALKCSSKKLWLSVNAHKVIFKGTLDPHT